MSPCVPNDELRGKATNDLIQFCLGNLSIVFVVVEGQEGVVKFPSILYNPDSYHRFLR